jgi:hypothetical protein
MRMVMKLEKLGSLISNWAFMRRWRRKLFRTYLNSVEVQEKYSLKSTLDEFIFHFVLLRFFGA